ncbi:MAG: DUF1343 domain-containing protein [Bacteriovoracaceae bacterium]
MTTRTGLDQLKVNKDLVTSIKGNVAYLCNSASLTYDLITGICVIKELFGARFKKLFGPQHGLFTDLQDNMIETSDFIHPYFGVKVHSLYSTTRIPTPAMLEGIDAILVDLQDVGTRVYTYIYTLTLLMEACKNRDIEVVVLDRPNPIDGVTIEGNMLDMNFSSFVGRHSIPMRHGLTIGEVATLAHKAFGANCNLRVIKMENWQRSMSYDQTKLHWTLPSPNLPTIDSAYTFVGTVLFEGTNISEGRGTTRSLEIIGHPKLEPFSFLDQINPIVKKERLAEGAVLRPTFFQPTFNKHKDIPCGGIQIHVTDKTKFRPWLLTQFLMRELYFYLNDKKAFSWKEPPYEYEYIKAPIDLINGTDKIRNWIENRGDLAVLREMETSAINQFANLRNSILLYKN